MKYKITKAWAKSFFVMIAAVIVMGMGVSLLAMCDMGTDPCSAMNYGISSKLGMSFGNYQLLFNAVLLLFVVIFERKLIGTGTFGNMILVGYAADFFTWVWKNVCHVPQHLDLGVRMCILIPSLILFVLAAAVYMQIGHGMAPYDALPFLVSHAIEKHTGKDVFRLVRMLCDLTAAGIGFLTGGEVGVMTVLMVVLLGPTVNLVGSLLEKKETEERCKVTA